MYLNNSQTELMKLKIMSFDNSSFEEKDWQDLLRVIKKGKCTSFIGAGASYP